MKYLYIDTSSAYLYTGIVEDNNLLIEKKEFLEHNLSKESLFIVSKMFEEANIKVDDIDKILVVTGPGSFTGIRVGLTFAKVYAWAKNIPIKILAMGNSIGVLLRLWHASVTRLQLVRYGR